MNGYIVQVGLGTLVTLKLAACAAALGMVVGLLGAIFESIPYPYLRYPVTSLIFLIRGLPELLVLFFIYFGLAIVLQKIFHRYVDISPFVSGVVALGLIFGAYAAKVFRGAFLAVDKGQVEAGKVVGLTRTQIFFHIELPQAWRHALPGIGNLWLVLLKDTAIVTLIGLSDMMNQAKLAASTTHQPFTYYFIAACIYLLITYVSGQLFVYFNLRANRYLHG